MSDFEYKYKYSQETAIHENGELPTSYDEFQMKNMCEYFYGLGIEKLEQENKKLCEIKPLLVTIYDYLNIENEGVNKTEQDICFKIKEILDKG